MSRSFRPMLAACALLAACAAEGTDFEALPFYREDRARQPIARVDIPLLLTSLDAADLPARSPDEPNGEPLPDVAAVDSDGEVAAITTLEPTLIMRCPWPLGLWMQKGTHHNFSLTAMIGFQSASGFANAGPGGRAAIGVNRVLKHPVPNLARGEPDFGGIVTLPLSFYSTLVDHDDLPDTPGQDLDEDVALLPLFAWGGGDEEHSYFAVFPFGGTTKGILGKEKIEWWGFPFPAYAKVTDRAYDSTHIVFPFYNSVEGPRHRGWRILPFYGHYEHKDSFGRPVYERHFVMWPFVTWQTLGMNEPAGPTSVFFAFPFYGRIDGPLRDTWTVLWPFFRWEQDDGPDQTWELRAPFPFLILGGGRDRYRYDLWPLIGFRGYPGNSRQFFLWPLFRHSSMESDHSRFSGLWCLPLFWRTRWEHQETGTDETRLRVWPLLHYRKLADGSRELALLSPWFFEDPDGFERVLGPLLRLYRYVGDPDGGSQHQLLFGLCSWRGIPEGEGQLDYSRLSLLFGLFHWRRLGEEHGLRLFWLPEITWGGGGDT